MSAHAENDKFNLIHKIKSILSKPHCLYSPHISLYCRSVATQPEAYASSPKIYAEFKIPLSSSSLAFLSKQT